MEFAPARRNHDLHQPPRSVSLVQYVDITDNYGDCKTKKMVNFTRARVLHNSKGKPYVLKSYDDLPFIHPALGIWPRDGMPRMRWDLSNPSSYVCTRALTENELEASPITPPQRSLRLVLDKDLNWVIRLVPREGYRLMTFRCFLGGLGNAMHHTVPFSKWKSASVFRKVEILRAYLKRVDSSLDRTGEFTATIEAYYKFLTTNKPDIAYIQRHFKGLNENLDNYVKCGAVSKRNRSLRMVDLLGENNMFQGLTFVRVPDMWELKTTSHFTPGNEQHMPSGPADGQGTFQLRSSHFTHFL